ncbi:hypothetical protein LE181_00005, partial [Streptomyces sp. SCA3-4]|uniref:TreTu family toxin n=1 Tax=Streptomyces sichuanensis TaxID=2871810 RepID=UPI0021F08D54
AAAANAGENADAAASAADEAGGFAAAAGVQSARARSAAAAAHRHAREANRAAGAAQSLAKQAANAAYEARDAANSAADHADKAADQAELAAKHAGDATKAASESNAHAGKAKEAANAASAAVKKAEDVQEIARGIEAEELKARTAAAIEQAKDLKQAEEERKAKAARTAKEAKDLDDEQNRLAAEAAKPGADVKDVAVKARRVALMAMKSRGPWSQSAAAVALASTDEAARDYVMTGWKEAAQQDERARVERLADEADSEPVRKAATEALKGDAAKIGDFLRTGQHQAAVNDYRVRVVQVANDTARGVQQAAQAALKDGSPEKLLEFLNEGQYTARESDERVRAVQLFTAGGAEVKAAAQVALEGPPQVLHGFIQTGQYIAARKDQLTASHVAQVKSIISEASIVSANAQKNAAEAARVAAIANKAAEQARGYAKEAEESAKKAKGYADDALNSAKQAEASAADAAKSAKTARNAAAAADRSAADADRSAAYASASEASARSSADAAYAAATEARASATAAGKDSAAADKAAKDAYADAAAKLQKEIERRAEEARKQREEIKKQEEAAREAKKKAWGDFGHFLLDVVGGTQIPIVSQLANGANCIWYGAEKDYLNAGMSCLAMVPVAGAGATAAKLGKDGAKGAELLEAIYKRAAGGLGRTRAGKACKILPKGLAAPRGLAARGLAAPQSALPGNSFTADTPVVMADGTTKAIQNVRTGDKVLASDPATGTTEGRPVDKVIAGKGEKHLVTLTVDTDGDKGGATHTITATEGHPFWTANPQAWVKAGELKPGALLRTSAGTWVKVTATSARTENLQVFNLSVSALHTYYVGVGPVNVLVHNTGGEDELVRVGRWMSQNEHDKMVSTGMVQEGAGGRTYVVHPPDKNTYKPTYKGSVYVEFDVPKSSLYPGGRPTDFKMASANSNDARYAAKLGRPIPELPAALNISLEAGPSC